MNPVDVFPYLQVRSSAQVMPVSTPAVVLAANPQRIAVYFWINDTASVIVPVTPGSVGYILTSGALVTPPQPIRYTWKYDAPIPTLEFQGVSGSGKPIYIVEVILNSLPPCDPCEIKPTPSTPTAVQPGGDVTQQLADMIARMKALPTSLDIGIDELIGKQP